MRRLPIVLAVSGILFVCGLALRRPVDAQQKPPITLDEFFNSVDFTAVRISPDGGAVAIATERADWEANRNRDDLWLYRARRWRRRAYAAHSVRPRSFTAVVAG